MDPVIVSGIVLALVLLVLVVVFVRRRRTQPPIEAPRAEATAPIAEGEVEESAVTEAPDETAVQPEPKPSAPDLKKRLSATRKVFERFEVLWSRSAKETFSSTEWDEIEEGLLAADVSFSTTSELLERVRERAGHANGKDLQTLIREEVEQVFQEVHKSRVEQENLPKPLVISIVGVNGVGKTTTIGKLAHNFLKEGRTVLLGAADTFRAGAISQLKVWADRVGAEVVSGREGGDPGAVAFDSVKAAEARGIDVVLIDTAGRLHTKTNLMDELKKVHRVMKKVIPEAPHETWIVLDGTLGQNSIQQAKQFGEALDVSGVVVTKLDGTAKGGAILSVATELKLPIRYIGVGESMVDLVPFESKSFSEAIFG